MIWLFFFLFSLTQLLFKFKPTKVHSTHSTPDQLKMPCRNRFLALILLSAVLCSVIASPIFEVGENLVEDGVTDKDADEQGGFERTGADGFENMNDFNFDENPPSGQPDAGNQSAEQNEDDGPPSRGAGRERNAPSELGKASGDEESENGPDGDGSGEADKPGARKQKYQDGEEGGARSLDGEFEAFDKEGDGEPGNRPPMNSAEEGPRSGGGPPGGPPMPPMEQIDEPLIVNPGVPLPMPMHGARSGAGRANSEEANGGNYEPNRPNKAKSQRKNAMKKKRGAPGYGQPASKDYKFLPSGIKYLMHEASRTRIARHPLASFAATVDHRLPPALPTGQAQLLFYPLNRNPELLDAALP